MRVNQYQREVSNLKIMEAAERAGFWAPNISYEDGAIVRVYMGRPRLRRTRVRIARWLEQIAEELRK
jgi:hypothetical protein